MYKSVLNINIPKGIVVVMSV